MVRYISSTIINDEDKEMTKKIIEVLPNATYKLCYGTFYKTILEYLTNVRKKFQEFQKA